MMPPLSPLDVPPPPRRGRVRRLLSAVASEHASPRRLSVAVGLGVFLGCTPLIGFHLLLALLLGTALRLNRMALVLGTQISFPPLMPFLYVAEAQVGGWILRGRWPPLNFGFGHGGDFEKRVAELFVDILVGSLVVGVVLALLFAVATDWAVTRARRKDVMETP